MKKIFIILILAIFLGCTEPVEFKFKPGDFVTSVLNGQKGQVTFRYVAYTRNYYQVRFASDRLVTKTHILSNDDPIAQEPFSLIEMQEFELKPYED